MVIDTHFYKLTKIAMQFILDMNLGRSDAIAFLSFLVAGLSALYTRWSWKETKKANQITLIKEKKEIYDAFFELKMHMSQNAQFAELSEVSKFYYQQKNAKLFLPEKLSSDIEKYFEACFQVAIIHKRNGGASSESHLEYEQHLSTEERLSGKIENELIKIIKEARI